MRKEIKWSNMPSRPPVVSTLVIWIALEYWRAPGWLWGSIGVLVAVQWVSEICGMFARESVDVIERIEAIEKEMRRPK